MSWIVASWDCAFLSPVNRKKESQRPSQESSHPRRDEKRAQVVRGALEHPSREVVRAHDGRGPLDLVPVRDHDVQEHFAALGREGLGIWKRARQLLDASGQESKDCTRKAQRAQVLRVLDGTEGDPVDLWTCGPTTAVSAPPPIAPRAADATDRERDPCQPRRRRASTRRGRGESPCPCPCEELTRRGGGRGRPSGT